MEVHFNPNLESRLAELAEKTGHPADDLVQDVVAEYFDELAHVRETLDGRYDDLKSGQVQPIDGEHGAGRSWRSSVSRRSCEGTTRNAPTVVSVRVAEPRSV